MQQIDQEISANGLAIATYATLLALFEALIAKGQMDSGEIVAVLKTAASNLGRRANGGDGAEAFRLLDALAKRLSKNQV